MSLRASTRILALVVLTAVTAVLSAATPTQADVVVTSVSLGAVDGEFFFNPTSSGAFTASASDTPVFTQTFAQINFNPPSGTVPCTNDTGIGIFTRPFTDVIQQPDGSCSTVVAEGNGHQAGLGDLTSFDAAFSSTITVAQAGNVTFGFFSDDGWILGIGAGAGGAQPSYVSGSLVNAPTSSPIHGYPVVGAFNEPNPATENAVVVSFPVAGTYPAEFDYTECCGGALSFTAHANGAPIPPSPGGTKSTSTTYTGGSSVQYSDPVSLSGTLLDTSVSPNLGIAGKQLDFTLGTQTASASPTDVSGNVSTSLQVLQKPGSVTTVDTSFAGDATYLPSSDSDPFSITNEDCTLTYSGDTLVPPATMTNLAADMGEPDASLGDRSNKTVTFTVTDALLNQQTFTATTDASGRASTSVALADGVYGVSVSFAGDDFYLPCATATDTIVTVEAAAAKATGGGWIAIGTGRTSFGFNAIPIAGGGFRGQFQLRSNNGKNRFHGSVVSSLSGSGNTATWSGTGDWNGQPGYTYTISVVDNGSSGSKKGDTIIITITSPTNTTVYTTDGPQTLKGGNITVH